MAWDYGDSDNDPGGIPDYSGSHDYSGDNPDYSNMSDDELNDQAGRFPDQDALHQDIMSGGSSKYKSPRGRARDTFKNTYRDEMNKRAKGALGNAERDEGGKSGPARLCLFSA